MTTQPLRMAEEDGRRQPARHKLTQAYIRKVQPPARGRLTIYDTEQKGLAYVVTSGNARSWYLIRKVNGRARRAWLSDGGLAVEDARKLCRKTIADFDAGKDPVAERRARRAKVTTLGELWKTYTSERERRPRTITAEASLWKNLKSWESRGLDAITPEEVAALHSRLKKRGRTTANRTVELLRRVYAFALKRRLYKGENPAAHIEFYQEPSRDRYVTPAELPKLLGAIDAEAEPWPDYFRLLLLTGARRSALAQMRWEDLDLKEGVWRIPPEHSKNKDGLVVPLVPEAVKRLKRRRTEGDADAVHVFTASRRRGDHITNPHHAWKRIRENAGVPDLTIHDLRRTFGSYLAAAAVPLPIIGKALGHRSHNATAVYARLNVEPVRRELAHVADMMSRATKGKGQS